VYKCIDVRKFGGSALPEFRRIADVIEVNFVTSSVAAGWKNKKVVVVHLSAIYIRQALFQC
jgi:aspartokinase